MSTFNELIDFTRSTTGTYLDSVVYGDELVTNGDFATDSDWDKEPEWTIANGVATFDDVNNANLQQPNMGLVVGKSYLFSFEITSGATPNFSLFASGSSDQYTGYETYSVGTHQLVFTCTGGDGIRIAASRFLGSAFSIDNVSVKEVIGGQVSGTPLLRTAAINEPRLDYDASGNPLGLLIEEARSNLVTSSLFNTAYTNQSVTRVLNQSGAPDGTSTSTKVLETGGTAFHRTFTSLTFISGNIYTQSVYAKSIGGRVLQLTAGGQSFGAIHVNFDLENGVVGSSSGYTSASITDAGNGWYRCLATATASQTNSTDSSIVSVTSPTSGRLESFAGDTSKGLLVFGHQVETGAFPTSYIPTSGSTATRSRDLCDIPVERFGYNTAQGSVVVNFNASNWIGLPNDSVFYRIFKFAGNTGSNTDGIFRDPVTNGVRYRFNEDDATTPAIGAANLNVVSANGNKVAVGLKGGSNYIVMDGGTDGQGTGTAATNLYSSLVLSSVSDLLNGHIKHIQYYPKRLSNTELQLLTQPSASPTMNLTFDGQATSTLVEGLHD